MESLWRDRFGAARLKVERAKRHIADLSSIVSALPDAYVSTVESDPETGAQFVKFTPPNVEKIAVNMALIIGDAVHNLRTAVEYSYLGAIERHIPDILDHWTKFPIYESAAELESALKGRGIDALCPPLFHRIVTGIRPYDVGGNGLIKLLHDLDVSDKHWLLIPLLQVGTVTDIVVEDEQGHRVMGNTYPIVGSGPYTVAFPRRYRIMNGGKLAVQVVFDKVGPIALIRGQAVVSLLEDFSRIASHIVQALSSV
jgi:hypothetical protein